MNVQSQDNTPNTVIVVNVTNDWLDENVVNDGSAPDSIKSCKFWGEPLIQDLSNDVETTSFRFIDQVFVETSCSICKSSLSFNTECSKSACVVCLRTKYTSLSRRWSVMENKGGEALCLISVATQPQMVGCKGRDSGPG